MRIIICDYDQYICEELESYLREYFQMRKYISPEIVIYNSGKELLNDTGDMGIVFLDAELPGSNGIQIGKELKKRDKHIIIFILSTYYKYIDDAMDIQVFRYLTKPINKRRLFRNIQSALYAYFVKDERITVKSGTDIYSVRMMDIICIQTDLTGEKVFIHTTKGSYRTLKGLNYWEEVLDSKAFFRSHRSNIINMEYVTQFNREEIKLYDNQFTAYMARRHYTQFKEQYMFFLESKRR